MNGIRKVLCLLWAMVTAALAFPGIAVSAQPQKLYALQLDENAAYAGQVVVTPVPVTVTVKNESNAGANSNIGSFRFTLVGLKIVNQPSCPGAICTADLATNTVTVRSINPPIQAPGGTFPVFLNVSSCGDGTVPVATTTVWSGQLNGATFAPNTTDSFFVNTASIKCGDIDCDTAFTVPDSTVTTGTPTNDPRRVAGGRGKYDTDGSCAAAGGDSVPYIVANGLFAPNYLLDFRWPDSTGAGNDPFAAFAFKVNLVASATPTPTVKFAWGSGPLISGDSCTLPNAAYPNPPAGFTYLDVPLPAPYAILSQDAAPTDTKIKVDPSGGVVAVPTAAEFDIMIGAERMRVTKHTSNTWDVVRNTGGTLPATSTYPAGTQVVRTAQPLVHETGTPAFYSIGDKAQACVAFGPIYNGDGTWSVWVIASGDPFVNFSP